MIILQISPEFNPGTGVGGVAHSLEREWLALGHDVRRFGPEEAGCGLLAEPRPGLRGRLRHACYVVWFSTIGTVRARRTVRRLPQHAVSICHNDALAGDIYVNHGVLASAMHARGRYMWRMLRNPLHLFTTARDYLRYIAPVHRLVVNLTNEDDQALKRTYPRLRPSTRVLSNGVDTERFRPPSASERASARARLSLPHDALLTIFIGNEYERKGLFPLIDAIAMAGKRHHLAIVGGTSDMTARLKPVVRDRRIGDRCHIVGTSDPLPYLWAADLLAQPSSYESYGLVVTEALAAGVPVLSTPVGVAPDVIESGVNGYLSIGTATEMHAMLSQFETADREAMRTAARESVRGRTWTHVARAYMSLFSEFANAG